MLKGYCTEWIFIFAQWLSLYLFSEGKCLICIAVVDWQMYTFQKQIYYRSWKKQKFASNMRTLWYIIRNIFPFFYAFFHLTMLAIVVYANALKCASAFFTSTCCMLYASLHSRYFQFDEDSYCGVVKYDWFFAYTGIYGGWQM